MRHCRATAHATFETDHTTTRAFGAAIFGVVELLLRERRHQQPQALKLLGIEDTVEELEEVVKRHQLALRDIAEVGPGGEK